MRLLYECSICHQLFLTPWESQKCETQRSKFQLGDWLEEFGRYGQVVHLIPSGGHGVLPICAVARTPDYEERVVRWMCDGKVNDLWWLFPFGELANNPPAFKFVQLLSPPKELIERLIETYGEVK